MEADVDAAVVVEGVAGVGPAGVGAKRALQAPRVVAVPEVVVALRVGAELGVVTVRGEGKGGAALPAAHHLRAQQLFLGCTDGGRAQVLAVGRDPGVQLAEHHVGAVAAQVRWRRHRRQLARLVGVAQDDLAGLDRLFARVGRRPAAALDAGLADPVLEPERGAPGRQLVAVLAPDQLDAWELLVRTRAPFDDRHLVTPASGERAATATWTCGVPRGCSQTGRSGRRLRGLRRGPPSLPGTRERSCPGTPGARPVPSGPGR